MSEDSNYKGKISFLGEGTQYFRSLEDQAYFEMMVEQRKKLPKKPASTVQSASTQTILDRHAKGEFGKSFEGDIPLFAQVKDDKGNVFINERPVTVQEVVLIEGMRRSAKNELGASEKSATTPELRERAVNAFTYSKPTELSKTDVAKLTELDRIKELDTLPEVKEELSWFQKILNKFKKNTDVSERYSYAELQKMFPEKDEE